MTTWHRAALGLRYSETQCFQGSLWTFTWFQVGYFVVIIRFITNCYLEQRLIASRYGLVSQTHRWFANIYELTNIITSVSINHLYWLLNSYLNRQISTSECSSYVLHVWGIYHRYDVTMTSYPISVVSRVSMFNNNKIIGKMIIFLMIKRNNHY